MNCVIPSIRITLMVIICFIGTQNSFVQSEIPRPRGVSISRASLYQPGDTFQCLDGKKTIKYIYINDDYCDCDDGSDEPGTSACSNGQFHCTNAGFKPKNIPSSQVNDGICDCCDASDEYQLIAGSSACVNNCNDLGKLDQIREKQMAELVKVGNQIRVELATKGKLAKTENENRLIELRKSYTEAEALAKEREEIKKQAEAVENEALEVYREANAAEQRQRAEQEATQNAREAEENFQKYDSNGNGLLELAELQTRIIFDRNRDGEVSIEEAKYFLNENNEVNLETFKTICWPLIKPFLMLDSGLFKPPPPPPQNDNGNGDGGNNAADEKDNGEHERNDFDEGDEHAENGDEDEHGPVEGGDDEEEEEEYEEETGEGDVEELSRTTTQSPEPAIEYDEDTKIIIEQANGARNLFLEADRQLRELKTQVQKIEEILEKDYGPNEEFSPLEGECFNYEDREYVYKVCPFDRAVQQPKSGGAETRLGTWERWDGKDYKYSTMYFSNGAPCWNGPQRSATIHLECGLDTIITSVAEPNRCEYVYTMQTPAACGIIDSTTTTTAKDTHDEL